jgi:ubiquinone/menaquinone biosynthesis C-methylase UbiE
MTRTAPEHSLRTRQYADDANLSARISLHRRFSVSREPWYGWLFRQMDLSGNPRIVDIGCGNAGFWQSAVGLLPSLSAILCDFSLGMLKAAGRAVAQTPMSFPLVQAHAAKLPFPDCMFDLALANHMLYHVQEVDHALEELHRILRANGVLYASTNGPAHLRELDAVATAVGLATCGDHAQNFSLSSGPKHLARLFQDVSVVRYPNHLEVTDAQAALEYLSSAAEPTPSQSRQLLGLVQGEIQMRGYFGVTIESGLIAARRAA